MRSEFLLIKITVIAALFSAGEVHGNETCWNNGSECEIAVELFQNMNFSNGISLQIDCRLNLEAISQDHLNKNENDFQMAENYLLLPRFTGVQSVMLDGCQMPLNAHTFGLEFLPLCANITKVSVRHFHMDTLKALHCNTRSQQTQLEYLNIQFNEIAVIDEYSFPRIHYRHLRDVVLESNSLKSIHKDAFKSIVSLENLCIGNEPMLILKHSNLFEFSSVSSIHLETLKQMTSDIFQHLPETLQSLYVANTQLDNGVVFLRNSLALRNFTITNCTLENFSLRDVHSTVKRIDLSGNVMKTFTAYENNLKELNLGYNQLGRLPFAWIKNLTHLEILILKGNRIKVLPLNNLFEAVPHGQLIDLSQNLLQNLLGVEEDLQDVQLSQVRLKCDQNPWDCLWLHEFAHYHPEKFRILQYEKFISKINVNGLECVPAEKSIVNEKLTNKSSKVLEDRVVNVSAYNVMYGQPWEYRRNQRAEALIIVFMLPLGIAILFMLLYMWIYCQKMFHMSYYQGLACMQRSHNHSTQGFDIIRQLPPRLNQTEPRRPLTRLSDENDEGYEIPITSIIAECNCIMQQSAEIDKCEKAVHITYEHLPIDEPPSHQIYEEIMQAGISDGRIDADNAKRFNC